MHDNCFIHVRIVACAGAMFLGSPSEPLAQNESQDRPHPKAVTTSDTDGDGLLDALDNCRLYPETYNRFNDADGCPDTIPDFDSDGFSDTDDPCPASAEDPDGFEDRDGCPDHDNDRDHVLDDKDICPNAPGLTEYEGCPFPIEAEPAKTPPVTPDASLTKIGTVYFAHDSYAISASGREALERLTSLLKASPGRQIRVDGYADASGSARYNHRVSELRAQQVTLELHRLGIDAKRVTFAGHGEASPSVPGTGKANGDGDRRVDIFLLPSTIP